MEKREEKTEVLNDMLEVLTLLRGTLEQLGLDLFRDAYVGVIEVISVIDQAEKVKDVAAILHDELKEIHTELEMWIQNAEIKYGTSTKMFDMNSRIWDLGEAVKSLATIVKKEYPTKSRIPKKAGEKFDDFIDELSDIIYESSAGVDDAINEIESLQGK